MTREEFKNKYSKKLYLGDGLFAYFDGYHIFLTTERDGIEHYVGLEPEVFENLLIYRKSIYEDADRIID